MGPQLNDNGCPNRLKKEKTQKDTGKKVLFLKSDWAIHSGFAIKQYVILSKFLNFSESQFHSQ